MASEETASSGPRTPDASTAAVYVRSNSAHDRAVQLATCLADAEQRGLTVDEPHIFIEVTDASDQWYDRPELALMHQAMVRGEFAVLVVASGHVLFGSSQDLDGFTRLMSNFGVKLLVVSPHATAELGPLARDWIIKNLAHGDEQTYERAAETVRRTTQFLATTAVASLNSLLAPHPQGDRSAVPLGPTTPAPRAPAPAGQAAYRPPSDRGPQSAGPPSGIPELPETAQAYGAPSPISAQLTARAKQGVQALVADHVAHVTNRTANQDTGYLNRSAGRRVRRAYAFLIQPLWFAVRSFWTATTVVVESLPGPDIFLGFWGPGDVVTLLEAIAGWTMDGLHLSRLERMLYVGASAVPLVPARPVVGTYRRLEPWLRGDTRAGWAFLVTQFPPWLRRQLPDPFDPRSPYPRAKPVQVLRKIVSFAWLPIVLYLGVVAARLTGQVVSAVSKAVTNWTLQPLGDLLKGSALSADLLLDRAHTLVPQLSPVPGLLGVGCGLVAGLLLISTFAQHDGLREVVVVAIRSTLPQAHQAAVAGAGAALRAAGVPVADKLAQAFLHLQDASLKTARSIGVELLRKQAASLAISLGFATGAFVLGVAIAAILHV